MKASLKVLTFGLLLLGPIGLISTAHAQAPSLSPIANVTLNAGTTQNVNVIAIDINDDVITLTAALPPFVTLNTPTIGTGEVSTTLTLAPTAAHVGDYSAAVTATAGGVSTVRVFQISVNAAGTDRAPIVTTAGLQEVTEGAPLTFMVNASDADGDVITSLTATGLPTGASFAPNPTNTAAAFDWIPALGDAGEYDVQFTATNALSGTSVTHIRVASAPALGITPIDDVTVAGGGSASVAVHASGLPGSLIVLTAALPSFATLNPPGSGTGTVNTTITVAPPTGSAGTYHASITATSEGNSVTEEFDIIVTGDGGGDNHPPVLTAPANATVAIGSTLSFNVTATDQDGDHVDLFGSALPPGSNFTDNADNTGTFTWTPVAGQGGTYTASFTGLDNRGGSGSASTSITVTGDPGGQNQAPTVTAPATKQVDEGENLSFTVTATDPDGDPVALSANALPAGATFTDNGNNSGTFLWTPGSTQSGNYTVAFLGNDGQGGTGTASTAITVNDEDDGGDGDGDGVVRARACLIINFFPNRDQNSFRLKPVDRSFDVRDVVLSSIRLRYQGASIAAANAAIELHCHGRGNGHGDDLEGDGGDDGAVADGANDDCGVRCKPHPPHQDDPGKRGGTCDTLGIRAGISTDALVRLLVGETPKNGNGPVRHALLCALADAEMEATLTNGATVLARFKGDIPGHGHDDDGDDDQAESQGLGKGKGKGIAGGDHGGWGRNGHVGMLSARVTPNPLNPNTELSFTTTRDGRVRVVVVDMQGRLVKRLLDEFRTPGSQTLAWDGTDERSLRVACGVYFLWIQSAEGTATRRVTVVK